MAQIDLSTVVLELTAVNSDAITSFRHPDNEAFLVPVEPSDQEPVHRRAREGTPLANSQSVRAFLRTDCYPYDPLLGWVFGRKDEEEECDFFLGTKEQGVSRKHFRIDHNWKAMTLILTNMSGHGTKWASPDARNSDRVMTSRAILPGEQYSISAGAVELILQIPARGEDEQANFDSNIGRLRLEVEEATPTMNGLKIEPPGPITPLVVGRQRRFVLQNVIGSGAMALVYKAVDFETGDVYAAKAYKLAENTDLHLLSMLNEIKILQKLEHRNIIEYIDLFKDPDPILVMEMAVKSLAEHKITRVNDCVALLKDCLAGLTYLHKEKIIHRDVKPANILLTNENPTQWKLSDFGLSKIAEITTTFCGSPSYLAPEIGGLEYSAYTATVDIWALGIVGLEYTCGIPPGKAKLLQDRTKRGPWNDAVIRQIPLSSLARYLRLMLEPVPAKRPSAATMADMLESWADSSGEVLRNASQHEEGPATKRLRFKATMP
ncbi:hypothetical protein AYL99_01924 [Fonsecaea erecta]|uniref:Serine/threonine-protein kinase ATG1 n=1 Tax=Fonsecaea erecta TaxID=1367422 RepID=A0A178ZSA3_9EURO|nr:hypothetical protein AYL99_01924 [Fonsecaea erecta]OAP62697.1 hypothetical protein AYL99_01924 [Fonsecaea erecta]